MRDALIRDQERNVWLVHCCYALASKGQVLLLSHRREHLQGLLQKFEQLQGATEEATKKYRGALYVGGLTEAQRATASQAHVLFGTYQMAAEGLDIPTLGVLVLATPAGDIEQALGRILRTSPQKTETWVLDVEDEFHQSAGPVAGMLRNWSRQRQRTLRTLDFKTHRAASTEEVLTLLQKPLGQTTLAQANKDMSSDSTATMVEVVDGEDGSMDVDPFDL
jgi:superfamily II DNA or RNA helicase